VGQARAVVTGHPRRRGAFRWLAEVPLRDGRDALKVNWFEIEISNAAGDITYRNSFITDMPIGCDTVADLLALDGGQRPLRLEGRIMCPACPFCHARS
jgi:hypothetical protein